MRTLLLLLALPLLATFAPKSMTTYAPVPDDPVLWVEPVALREEQPQNRRLGALTFIETAHGSPCRCVSAR